MIWFDTIAAVATPPGVGGVGIVRLSGPDSLGIAKTLFSSPDALVPRYFAFGDILDGEQVIDSGGVLYFEGPASFTGEDVVEFHTHGSRVILSRLLQCLIRQGARLAEAGEFSKRAFLNGKLDLTQAESVIDLIHASGEISSQVSLSHLKGALYEKVAVIRRQLLEDLQQMEASIDFPDEVEPIETDVFRGHLSQVSEFCERIIELGDFGRMVHDGVRCLIVGAPNVGKSSLLNMILGEDRAIVSGTAGTTRDFIESSVQLGGLQFEFVDTAGLRKSQDEIESEGIGKVRGLQGSCHALFWVVDGNSELSAEEMAIPEEFSEISARFLIVNKSDLDTRIDLGQRVFEGFEVFQVSCVSGSGLDEVKARLVSLFSNRVSDRDLAYVCNARQIACVSRVLGAVKDLRLHLDDGFSHDVLAIDMKVAISGLGELSGEEITEEVLDGVFSRFCVGK